MRIRFIEFAVMLALGTALCFGQGTISTVAGSSKCCNSADGGQAVDTWLPSASGITVDRLGNLYIWDGSSSKVRKVSPSGIITTVAGNGMFGYSGDGGPATSAQIFAAGSVSGLAVDAAGNLYIRRRAEPCGAEGQHRGRHQHGSRERFARASRETAARPPALNWISRRESRSTAQATCILQTRRTTASAK